MIATLLAATLPLTMIGTAHAQTDPITTEDPAEAAAGWLTTRLGDDLILQTGFGPSVGATIDAVLSFDAAGVAGDVSADVAAAVAAGAAGYAAFPDEEDAQIMTWQAGPLGKLLLLASSRPELDATDLGGVDAIAELEAIECTEGRDNCDPDDLGAYKGLGIGAADAVSTFNQAFAIVGLVASGATPSDEAVAFLSAQACDDGGYGFALRTEDSECSSAADTTGLVAQALLATGDDAAQDAIDWLLANQDDSGGFVGFAGVDASTTAFPVMALLAAGETTAATAGIQAIADLQAGCDAPTDLVGAIYYNEPDENGETAADDTFATAQATPALAGQHLLEISGAGSSGDVPVLACPTDEAADDPVDDTVDETDGADGSTDDTATDDPAKDDTDTDATAPDDTDDTIAADDDILPETGVTTLWLAAAGLLLLLLGGGALRLRRTSTPTA